MAKLSIILLFSSLFIISLLLPLAYSKTKVTYMRFYLQDQFNASLTVAYGDVYAFQDPLTVGPDPNSKLFGRAHGTLAITALDASFNMHMSVAYSITSGKYNGSDIVAVGRNDIRQSVRYFPIVGGTGAFKLARGIVTGITYPQNNRIFQYDLEIIQDNDITNMEIEYV